MAGGEERGREREVNVVLDCWPPNNNSNNVALLENFPHITRKSFGRRENELFAET